MILASRQRIELGPGIPGAQNSVAKAYLGVSETTGVGRTGFSFGSCHQTFDPAHLFQVLFELSRKDKKGLLVARDDRMGNVRR